MNIIKVRNSLLFCQELPEHLFLLVGIILSWTSIWVFIKSYRGTLGKVVKITCSQDDLRNSDSACVLQVSNAPPLAFHSPKCLLNDDSSPADVGVATKVCISKSPVVTPGGDDEGKILTDVCTIPQQTVLPHPLLPFLENPGGPQQPGIMHFARDSSEHIDESAFSIHNPLEEDRVEGLPVHVVHSSDPWTLYSNVAAINRSNDPLKATCALEAGGRHPLLTAFRPRDKSPAKGGYDG